MQQKTDRPTFVLRGKIASSPAFEPAGQEGIIRLASSVADYGSDEVSLRAAPQGDRRYGRCRANRAKLLGAGRGTRFRAHRRHHRRRRSASDRSPSRGSRSNARSSPTACNRRSNISGVMIDRAYNRLLLASDDPTLRQPTAAERLQHHARGSARVYAARYWRPDLTTIAVVGDLSPERVRIGARSGLRLVAGDRAQTRPASDGDAAGVAAATTTSARQANQVYIRLGQPAVSRSNPDYDTFLVLNQILGGSGAFESRLWQEMRQKRGLVYSVGSTLDANADRGDFRVELSASPQRVVEAVEVRASRARSSCRASRSPRPNSKKRRSGSSAMRCWMRPRRRAKPSSCSTSHQQSCRSTTTGRSTIASRASPPPTCSASRRTYLKPRKPGRSVRGSERAVGAGSDA